MHERLTLLGIYVPTLLTAGTIVWFQSLVTIEWTYPYCLDRSDGPAYAAQGLPLPYWMWNGVVSLEHDFVPHVYVLNFVILFLLFFPTVRFVWNRVFVWSPVWVRAAIVALGASAFAVHVALTVLMIGVGYYRPTTTLGQEGYYSYIDFRPVRIGFHRGNAPACTPSPFWFPNGWQRK